jgi:hypothetical protein
VTTSPARWQCWQRAPSPGATRPTSHDAWTARAGVARSAAARRLARAHRRRPRSGFGLVLGANCIVGSFADDHVHVVHRRGRILRRAHAARRSNFGGTLIPHAVARGAPSSTPRPIVIAVVGAALRTAPVTRLGSSHLRVTGRRLVRWHAVDLAPIAGPADRKQAQALGAPLEEKADVVHVERGRRRKTCPQRPPRASCASRRPRRGFRLPPGPLLFFGVLGLRIYGEILAGSTFLPTDPTVRSRRLQAAVNTRGSTPRRSRARRPVRPARATRRDHLRHRHRTRRPRPAQLRVHRRPGTTGCDDQEATTHA